MTMKPRDVLLGAMLAGVLAPVAQAQDEGQGPLRFSPAAGVQVSAEVQEDGMLAVLLQPAGKRQRLPGAPDADGNSRLSAEDLDFDGHLNWSRARRWAWSMRLLRCIASTRAVVSSAR